jgi:hypothetical protein
MRFDPEPGKMVNDIALLAETFIEVVVTIISVTRPLYPSPDFRTVRKFKCYLCGIPAGIEVDQISKFFGTEIPGTRKCKDKKDGIDDVAFAGSIGPGNNCEPL